ncbi:DUF1643 domain-containing protein [Nocardia transvalensis]|uniref:DUF1643 domain-containing protein n=1 Tax=Nocardia transvalensis TaxID=37333 RepID=UPI001894F011|nr:DUF1643 domain-containing protein [Nocardia transvalensis]MBF6333571.1 DUF1643 domain-containing protein [Nocardia transvalensis]
MTTPASHRDDPPYLFGVEEHRSAILSPCGTYRYELTRRWSPGPLAGWIMLNPSTADADVDDPTVRRCIAFARGWGYGGIVIRNLYALRASDPRELDDHPAPVGPDNDDHLSHCGREELTVLAWGSRGGDRGLAVMERLARQGVPLHQLAMTAAGQPRHPLYLPGDLMPTPTGTRRR